MLQNRLNKVYQQAITHTGQVADIKSSKQLQSDVVTYVEEIKKLDLFR